MAEIKDAFNVIENFEVETPEETIKGKAYFSDLMGLNVGAGDDVFRAGEAGVWLGAEEWASAPFRVDMDGNVVATSGTFSNYFNLTSGDLDDITDGGTYAKLRANNLSGGHLVQSGILASSFAPTSAGLYLTADYLGYYNGTSPYSSSAWDVYIDSAGNFYFGGDGSNYISWNGSTLDIRGDLVADDIIAGTLSVDRLAANSITKTKVGSDLDDDNINSINFNNITASNINAGTITAGTLTVGTGGVTAIYVNDNGTFGDSVIKWSGGGAIWEDSGNNIGLSASDSLYLYAGGDQKLYLTSSAQAVIGRDSSGERTGLYVWGNFNVDKGDARFSNVVNFDDDIVVSGVTYTGFVDLAGTSSAPGDPGTGGLWYDTGNERLRVKNPDGSWGMVAWA